MSLGTLSSMSESSGTYDAVVIGGGAAGLSAALVLARAQRSVLVVDAGEPRNAPAAHMHGFLSRDGMPPRELLAAGRDEVRRYGRTLLQGSGKTLSGTDGQFTVGLADRSEEHTAEVHSRQYPDCRVLLVKQL